MFPLSFTVMVGAFLKLESFLRCMITRWWRPACCVGFVFSLFENGVVLPLIEKKPADLTGLAALVTAITAAFAVREVGKRWQTAQ